MAETPLQVPGHLRVPLLAEATGFGDLPLRRRRRRGIAGLPDLGIQQPRDVRDVRRITDASSLRCSSTWIRLASAFNIARTVKSLSSWRRRHASRTRSAQGCGHPPNKEL
jgi:hypothetical protein